jgi:hypothetical protein
MGNNRIWKSSLWCLLLISVLGGCGGSDNSSAPVVQPNTANDPEVDGDNNHDAGPGQNDGSADTVSSGCSACPPLPVYNPDAAQKPLTVYVADFVSADSIRNEHNAIQEAIELAGEGGRVVFESGTTYRVCKMITALPDQLWQTSGAAPATLKRCDAVVGTLTADVLAGATELPVADNSIFEVGMWVSPVLAGRDDFHAGELTHHPVLSLNGEAIQVGNGLNQDYAAGAKVVTSFTMVRDAPGVIFEGLVFDGNAANNDHFVSWARHSSLWMASDGSAVRHSQFVASQGDAISLLGTLNDIRYNVFRNLNGSALHLSGARQAVFANNQVVSSNLKADRVNHAEAAITWSLNNEDIAIQNNCIQDIPAAAFGDIIAHGANRGATITDNQVCRVNSLLEAFTVETAALELDFSANVVESGGRIQLRGKGGASLEGVSVRNNTFEDVLIRATDTNLLVIQDNQFKTTTASYSILDASLRAHGQERNVTDPTVIAVRGGDGNSIVGNSITGAEVGVHIGNSNSVIANMTISGNTLTDQLDRGILVGDLATIDAANPVRADFRGVEVRGNQVITDQLVSGGAAVELGRGASFTNGCVESNEIGILIHGYAGNPLDPPARITGNTVVASGLSLAVAGANSLGIALADNSVSGTVSDDLIASNPDSQVPVPGATVCAD